MGVNKVKKSYKVFKLGGTSVIPREAEYKSIPVKRLKGLGYQLIREEQLEAAKNGYITNSLVSKFESKQNFELEESVIVNVGIGQGKTTAAYELILKYADNPEYLVLLASPYRNLVARDYDNLLRKIQDEKLDLKVINYTQIGDGVTKKTEDGKLAFQRFSDYHIHVMTINCLLGNPGDDILEQKFSKIIYLDELRSYCKTNKKKVVIFFDEIHDGIENFEQTEYIANLLLWRDIVQKTFILSATFTEASFVVLQYIIALTDFRFSVFYSPRIRIRDKTRDNAKLYLCVIPGSYQYDLENLSYLETLAERAVHENKRLNILCAYKSTAKELCNHQNDKNPLKELYTNLNPNLLTSETSGKNKFDYDRNNIGTTFKSGINLPDDSIYAIICPESSRRGNGNPMGIFSDGIPSIIQAVARVRKKGEIYIFFSRPVSFITAKDQFTSIPRFMLNKENENQHNQYLPLDCQYGQLEMEYDKYVSIYDSTIKDFENECKENGLTYPYFELLPMDQFILKRSTKIFMDSGRPYECYGKNVTPYIYWASKLNQFTNCRYVKDILFNREKIKHHFTWDSIHHILMKDIIPDNIIDIINPKPIDDSILFDTLKEAVFQSPSKKSEGTFLQNEYVIDGNHMTHKKLKDNSNFNKVIYELLIYYRTGHLIKDFKASEYILNNIRYSQNSGDNNKLLNFYRLLGKIEKEYLDFVDQRKEQVVIKGKEVEVIKSTLLTDKEDSNLLNRVKIFGSHIRENDFLIYNKHYSVFRNWKFSNLNEITERQVNQQLKDLFLNYRVMDKVVKGERYNILLGKKELKFETLTGPILR